MTSPPEPRTAGNPAGTAPPASVIRPIRVWDVVLTSMMLVAVAGLTLVVAAFGLYVAEAAQVCGGRACNTGEVAAGMFVATSLPWVILGLGIIVSIVLLVRRRLALWVPIVCAVLIVVVFFIGSGIAGAGIPPG